MAAIPAAEGPLVDQRHALKRFGLGLEGHAEALHPISVANDPHYLLDGAHAAELTSTSVTRGFGA